MCGAAAMRKITLAPGETRTLGAAGLTDVLQHISAELSPNSTLIIKNLACVLELRGTGEEGASAAVCAGPRAEIALVRPISGLTELRFEIGAEACLDVAPALFAGTTGPVLQAVFDSNGTACLAAAWTDAAGPAPRLRISGMAVGDMLNLAYIDDAGLAHAITELAKNADGDLRPTAPMAVGTAPFPLYFAGLPACSEMRWEYGPTTAPCPSGLVSDIEMPATATETVLFCGRVPHALRASLAPVQFDPDALAPGAPSRAIALAPWQQLKVRDVVLYAQQLLNGRTVTQATIWHQLRYVVPAALARGPSRVAGLSLLPTGGPVTVGPRLDLLRQHSLEYTVHRTHAALVSDSALRLEFNGRVVHGSPTPTDPHRWRFTLPAILEPTPLRILSRSWVARETSILDLDDRRVLGVALQSVAVLAKGEHRNVDICHAAWSGMHAPTIRHGQTLRWTNGMASLPYKVHGLRGGEVLELHIAETGRYWLEQFSQPEDEAP